MAASKEYFSHDYHARSELTSIQMNHGLEGLGFYWCFVEILHERGGKINEADLPAICYELHADAAMADKIVREYGLFIVTGGVITNDRVTRNLKRRKEVQEARRAAGIAGSHARWNTDEDAQDGEIQPAESVSDAGQENTRPAEETLSCGSGGFLDATEKEQQRNSAAFYLTWISERFDKYEEEAQKSDDFDEHPVWHCRGVFENIIKEAFRYPNLRIGGRNVSTRDFIEKVKWFVLTRTTLEAFSDVLRDVNEKAESGKLKNKQNYLIAAMYQAAIVHGG